MGAHRAAAAAFSFALVGGVQAADLKIVDVKAYAFLEHAGRLSEDLVSNGQSLVDAPKGGALGGDTATGLLLDFIFAGDRNASPKYATATVDLTQTGRAGQPVVTRKAFTNFIFGPDGIEHKAVFLEADLHAARHRGPCGQDAEIGEARLPVHGSARTRLTAIASLRPKRQSLPRPSTSAIE
jgi:hypothetical protein